MATKMTAEKKVDFENELAYLIGEGRQDVINQIQEARAFGDLSENYEYKVAREEQDKLEGRINEIKEILAKCELYEVKDSYDKIDLGCTVTIEDIDTERRQTLQVVGIYESDPTAEPKKVSNESPLGRALMGAEEGDEVDFEHKGNIVTYQIVKIH